MTPAVRGSACFIFTQVLLAQCVNRAAAHVTVPRPYAGGLRPVLG
jgi:hypothetical protein